MKKNRPSWEDTLFYVSASLCLAVPFITKKLEEMGCRNIQCLVDEIRNQIHLLLN